MTEVEKCRRELERAEREARQSRLTANERANKNQLVERARRKLEMAQNAEARDLQRAGR